MLLPMPKAEGAMKQFNQQFLVDFHEHWLEHGKGVLDVLALLTGSCHAAISRPNARGGAI
jgi:hypothetical protein